MLNAAIIGYGGIARVHESSYRELEKAGKVRLVAVYARNESSFTEKKDININDDDKSVVSDFHKYKENFGSCLHDLHIHDVDMCLYLFGMPDKVFCKSKDGFSAIDGVTSMFMYGDFAATVMADWSLMNYPFTSEYRVCFENATVTDLNGKVTVYPLEGEPFTPELSGEDGYTSEIAHFSEVAQGEKDHRKNHVRGAAETIKVINLLADSAEKGGRVLKVN